MAYQSWSVVFGEQPSAAKWNILGTNDSSFNDGTGVASLSWATTTLTNPYKFRAYLASAQNTGSPLDTYSRILFDTEDFDSNNNFDSTSTKGTYTAPVNGFYLFNYNVSITVSASESYEAALFVNGSIKARGFRDNVNTVEITHTGTHFIQLTAADTVDVRASDSSARALVTGTSTTNFSGFLVSKL